jgi:hypothetical protein
VACRSENCSGPMLIYSEFSSREIARLPFAKRRGSVDQTTAQSATIGGRIQPGWPSSGRRRCRTITLLSRRKLESEFSHDFVEQPIDAGSDYRVYGNRARPDRARTLHRCPADLDRRLRRKIGFGLESAIIDFERSADRSSKRAARAWRRPSMQHLRLTINKQFSIQLRKKP